MIQKFKCSHDCSADVEAVAGLQAKNMCKLVKVDENIFSSFKNNGGLLNRKNLKENIR